MPKDDHIEVRGKIIDAMGGGQYQIQLDNSEKSEIRAQLCGKMKKAHIRVLPGDRVTVSLSPYDLTHGIITYRDRN